MKLSKNLIKQRFPVWQRSLLVIMFVILLGHTNFVLAQRTASATTDGDPIQVTGVVTEQSTSLPLPGVNVYIEGTLQGTITDMEGAFQIEVPSPEAVLVFSFIGYVEKRIVVGNQTQLSINLVPDLVKLDEIVTIGYGVIKKRDVTASISTIKSKDLNRISTGNPLESIKGQVAGVDIQQTGGKPGQQATITIRGRSSITADKPPLFVVDGIPMANGESFISDLPPGDIESLEVLKDAAATAIYGSQGANGVILITTKRGITGKTRINYEGYYGITTPFNLPDFMNAEQFADVRRESWRSSWNGDLWDDEDIFSPTELTNLHNGVDTDWLDLMFENGYKTNHSISVMGGNEKTQFNLSGGYYDEQGLIKAMYYKRASVRLNLDHTINKYIKIGTSMSLVNSKMDEGSDMMLVETYANSPLGQPYDSTGALIFKPSEDGRRTNPLSELEPGVNIHETSVSRFFVPAYLEISPYEGLKYRMNAGVDMRFTKYGQFRGQWSSLHGGIEGSNSSEWEKSDLVSATWDHILSYNFDLNDVHQLTFTGIASLWYEQKDRIKISGTNTPFELGEYYTINQSTAQTPETEYSENKIAAFMGRAIYNYKGKYLFQGTLRYDGASVLTEGNKWNTFPGVSLGWRISDENFMENLPVLNDLKLRTSYGVVGSSSIDPYGTKAPLEKRYYAFGDDYSINYALDRLSARTLTWEESSTFDAGFDFALINNRIRGSFDYFHTRNTNLILRRATVNTSGYSEALQNIGETENKGVEFSISAAVLESIDGLKWNVNLNISHHKNKIVDLAGLDYIQAEMTDSRNIDHIPSGEIDWFFLNEEIDVYYDYKKIGIYQADEEELAATRENKVPGQIKLLDVDGDSLITPDDRIIYGRTPKYYGGIVNSFDYKGFDFSFFLYFKVGHYIRSDFNRNQNSLKGVTNNLDVDFWTPPIYNEEGVMIDPGNPTNANPRPDAGLEYARDGSTLRYFDGSYLKLRNVTLGYTLPKKLTKRMRIDRARFYLSGDNLWLLSEYDLFDPENGSKRIDDRDAPSTKTFLAGINLTF